MEAWHEALRGRLFGGPWEVVESGLVDVGSLKKLSEVVGLKYVVVCPTAFYIFLSFILF